MPYLGCGCVEFRAKTRAVAGNTSRQQTTCVMVLLFKLIPCAVVTAIRGFDSALHTLNTGLRTASIWMSAVRRAVDSRKRAQQLLVAPHSSFFVLLSRSCGSTGDPARVDGSLHVEQQQRALYVGSGSALQTLQALECRLQCGQPADAEEDSHIAEIQMRCVLRCLNWETRCEISISCMDQSQPTCWPSIA